MSLAQAVVLGIQHMAEKMPELPLPDNLPKINDELFQENPKRDNFQWILEDATRSTVDKTLLETIKKAKAEADEEGYILKHWREPSKVFRRPKSKNYTRTRDKVVRLKTSREFASKAKLRSPPPPDVRFLQRKEIEEGRLVDNEDVDMAEDIPDPKLPEGANLDEGPRIIRRDIAEDKSSKVSDKNLLQYYGQESFNEYVVARGSAPDLDREVQEIRKLKSQLADILVQKQIEKESDEEVISEEPQPSSSKIAPLEVFEVDSQKYNKFKKQRSLKLNSSKLQYIAGLSDSSDLSDDSGDELSNLSIIHNAVISVLKKPNKSQEQDFKNPKKPSISSSAKATLEDVIVLEDEGPKLIPIQKDTTSSTDSRGIPILEEEAEEDDRQFQNLRNPSGEEAPPVLEIQKKL